MATTICKYSKVLCVLFKLMRSSCSSFGSYETENGILGEENGRIEKQTEGDALRSTGFYHYTGDDGLLYRVDYTADENGFVPVGEHIPKVPEHIPRLLAYLKEKGAL